jgi:2-keto-4-pentenoate hydratase
MSATTPTIEEAVDRAVDRLEGAQRDGLPCAPVRDLLGTEDVTAAYAVQQRLTEHRTAAGARVVGRKIGLTSAAVQRQLGVDRPDFGVLFDDMDVSHLDEVPSGRLLQPKAEAEIAFLLADDLVDGPLDPAQCRAAVEHAVAAFEIVDSRIADWDITITDTVADNASSGLYVLGDCTVSLSDFEPAEVVMRLYVDDHLVTEGTGAACLGDPLLALSWLARTARDLGSPLLAGQIVLSGALGPMVPASPGARLRAEISSLGSVSATISRKEAR